MGNLGSVICAACAVWKRELDMPAPQPFHAAPDARSTTGESPLHWFDVVWEMSGMAAGQENQGRKCGMGSMHFNDLPLRYNLRYPGDSAPLNARSRHERADAIGDGSGCQENVVGNVAGDWWLLIGGK